jgi:O-antigen/teichoic acid export membrane protein
METVESETKLLAAVPAEIRARIFAGMRSALWLSVLATPFGYATNVVLARVGAEVVGTYGVLVVYVGVVTSLLYLGGDAVVIKFLPELAPARRLSFLGSYFLVIGAWLCLCLLVVVVRPELLRYLFGPGNVAFQVLLIGLSAICLLLNIVAGALKGVLEIRFAQALLRLLTVGQFLVYAALFFAFRPVLERHYASLVWAVYLGLALLAAAVGLRRLLVLPSIGAASSGLRFWLPSGFWRYTLYSQAVSVIWFFLAQLDSLLLLNLGGLSDLGRYVVIMTSPLAVKAVNALFLETFLPSLTNVLALRGSAATGQVFSMYWRLLLLVNVVMGCGLVLFVEPLCWLLGPEYAAVRSLLIVIVLLFTLSCPCWIGGYLLAGMGRQDRAVWIGLGQLGLYLALFGFAWPRWRLAGAVVAYGVSLLASHLVLFAVAQRSGAVELPGAATYFKLVVATLAAAVVALLWRPLPAAAAVAVLAGILCAYLWWARYTVDECRELIQRLAGSG